MDDEPQAEPGVAADVIVVRQSRVQRDGLFGALLAAFALAFARGFTGAQTAGGRIAVTVFAGVVTALLAWLWVRSARRPCHLEVSGQAITCVGARDQAITLSRQWGDELRVVSLGSARYRTRGLMIRGASTVIPLPFFSLGEIRRQCVARGWRFERAPRTARKAGRSSREIRHGQLPDDSPAPPSWPSR
jgi:hypothetical protein